MVTRIRGLTAPQLAAAVTAIVCLVTGVTTVSTRAVERTGAPVASSAAPAPSPAPASVAAASTPAPPETAAAPVGSGVATTRRDTIVRASAGKDAAQTSRLRAGVTLPILSRSGDWYRVLTPCQVDGWVRTEDVAAERPGLDGRPGHMDLAAATIVLDPGHGGSAPGAIGPAGLGEKDVNDGIIRKLAELLSQPHEVDWKTGAIRSGNRYEPPRVIVTRSGDYDAGLTYRASIANAARAHAFLSVHNNADPDGPSTRPGTETYYQIRSKDSKRLAGLVYEEVVTALSRFKDVAWESETDAGAKYRVSGSGKDYYGLLRRAKVPATLVEVAFISNASEEALLRTEAARAAVARALYRALVRFVTTTQSGSGFVEPYPRTGGPSGVLPSACTDPA